MPTPTEQAFRLKYIGTVNLLIEKHNHLANFDMLDTEDVEIMENVAGDFNRLIETQEMKKNGRNKFAIFGREEKRTDGKTDGDKRTDGKTDGEKKTDA